METTWCILLPCRKSKMLSPVQEVSLVPGGGAGRVRLCSGHLAPAHGQPPPAGTLTNNLSNSAYTPAVRTGPRPAGVPAEVAAVGGQGQGTPEEGGQGVVGQEEAGQEEGEQGDAYPEGQSCCLPTPLPGRCGSEAGQGDSSALLCPASHYLALPRLGSGQRARPRQPYLTCPQLHTWAPEATHLEPRIWIWRKESRGQRIVPDQQMGRPSQKRCLRPH